MRKIRKNDKVQVISGKFKGSIAKIVKVDGDNVYLEWINIVKRAVKWQWFVDRHLPIHISNVMYYCENCKKPVRVWIKLLDNKKKVRFCKKCETEIK